jgi:hypothetical protein
MHMVIGNLSPVTDFAIPSHTQPVFNVGLGISSRVDPDHIKTAINILLVLIHRIPPERIAIVMLCGRRVERQLASAWMELTMKMCSASRSL